MERPKNAMTESRLAGLEANRIRPRSRVDQIALQFAGLPEELAYFEVESKGLEQEPCVVGVMRASRPRFVLPLASGIDAISRIVPEPSLGSI
jgi:hypothetical protein